jgi:hypothetical protein
MNNSTLFAPLPLWLMRRQDVTPAAKLIFARLAFFDGQRDGAYPSKLGLARECGVSARSVFDGLQQLEGFGLIERAGFSRWKTVVYRVVRDHPWSQDHAAAVAVDAPDNLKPVGLSHRVSDQGQQNLHRLDDQGQQKLHRSEGQGLQILQFANDETPNPRRILHTKKKFQGRSFPGVASDRSEARRSSSSLLPDDAEIRRWRASARSFNSVSSSAAGAGGPNQQLHQ